MIPKNLDWMGIEYADDEKKCLAVLTGMINVYCDFYNPFWNLNCGEIEKFLAKVKNTRKEDLSDQEINLEKLIYFLNSWNDLIDSESKTFKKEGFNLYVKLNPKEEKEWKKSLNYAEKKKKWKGIRELNNKLQFIIAFNENIWLRKDYFKNVLWEVQKDQKKKEKDYHDKDIYRILFKVFKPKTNQYNYLQKIGN